MGFGFTFWLTPLNILMMMMMMMMIVNPIELGGILVQSMHIAADSG